MTSKTNLPLSCQKHHFTLKTISWSWAFDTHSSCLVWSRKSDSQGLACKGSHNAFKSVLDKSEQSQQIKLLNPLLKTLISASKILSALTFFFSRNVSSFLSNQFAYITFFRKSSNCQKSPKFQSKFIHEQFIVPWSCTRISLQT